MLWKCVESVVHFPVYGDELDDLMILPMACIFQKFDVIFRVVQFHNVHRFSRCSAFLGGLRRIGHTLLGSPFLRPSSQIDERGKSAFDGCSKPRPKNWRHERLRKKERQLAPHSCKTWEKWYMRNGWTLYTRLCFRNMWIAFSWLPLRFHEAQS